MYIMYVCMQPLSIVKRFQLFLFQNFSYVKNLLQFVKVIPLFRFLNNSFIKKKEKNWNKHYF